MTYKVQHITNPKKLQYFVFNPTTLTIHSTGNKTSTAQNERDYLNSSSNTSSTSFHIVVDDRQAIECLPLTMRTYHATDGSGPKSGNATSLSIEICESGNRLQTLRNAAWTAAKVLRERGWGVGKLRQHHDWHNKDCPRILRNAEQGYTWDWFVNQVEKELKEDNTMAKTKFPDVPDNHWAADRIAQMADLGLIKGFEDGTYKPSQYMSRAEMATVFGRFYDLLKKEGG